MILRHSQIKFFILAGVIVHLQGCMRSDGSHNGAEMTATLQEVDSLSVPLDTITTQNIGYLQSVDDNHIAFLNEPNYDICIYDISNDTTSKIQLYKDGPNAAPGVNSFCIVSSDSIWLYASWGGAITRVDQEGNVLERHRAVKPTNSKYSVEAYPMATAPYKVMNNKHILHGMNGALAEGQIPAVTLVYDAQADSCSMGNEYPAVYGDRDKINDWNAFSYRHSCYDIMPSGEILTSFAASDSLYIYNPADKSQKSVYAGYSSPVKVHRGAASSMDEVFMNHLNHSQYGGVFYDKYNDVYYRILRLPYESADRNNLRYETAKKPVVVIILDNDLNKIGETLLPQDSYFSSNAFVNSSGLHINVLSEDDDYLKFRVFKLQR